MKKKQEIQPTGIDYSEVYVYAMEQTNRDALQCAFGSNYTVEDYNDNWNLKTYDRYSTADAWITNNTLKTKTIWETKARPDVHIYDYEDGFFNVKKAASLEKIRAKHPYLQIYVALVYPKERAVVAYPLEAVTACPVKSVRALSPDQDRYVDEQNYLVPVSNVDRVHDAGGYIRHWCGCDWDDMYAYNERMGIELSERGLL